MRALILCFVISTALIQSVGECLQAGQREKHGRIDAVIDSALSQSREAASAALELFRRLVSENDYRDMGFESLGDVATATLGEPVVNFYVHVDSLRHYEPTANPSGLLTGGDRVVYPLLVRGVPRSSIAVARYDDYWDGVAYGGAIAAGPPWNTASQGDRREAQAERRYFLVLAMGIEFVGFEERGKLMLTPSVDIPDHSWKADSTLPADRVLSALAADARTYNGLPR